MGKLWAECVSKKKDNIFPQTIVEQKILLTRGLAREAEAQAVRREYSSTVTQVLGFLTPVKAICLGQTLH